VVLKEEPKGHRKIYQDKAYEFAVRNYGNKGQDTPGLFIHDKVQDRWLQITEVSTEHAQLGRSPDRISPKEVSRLSVSWDFRPLAKKQYVSLPLKTSGSISFPDRISFDKRAKFYKLDFDTDYFKSDLKRKQMLTSFWVRKADLDGAQKDEIDAKSAAAGDVAHPTIVYAGQTFDYRQLRKLARESKDQPTPLKIARIPGEYKPGEDKDQKPWNGTFIWSNNRTELILDQYKNGKRHGLSVGYFSLKKKHFEGGYVEGKNHGRNQVWDVNGRLIHSEVFKNGKKRSAEEFLAENKKKKGVVTTKSGLQYKILKAGMGKSPKKTDRVKVRYVGRLTNLTPFANSRTYTIPVTAGLGVLKGWTEAFQLMKVGAKWRLFIPPELGWGKYSEPSNVGPNEVLVYEMELLEIVK